MAKIIVPVVTVFGHDGKPDYEDNKKVIDYLIANHVDGILVLGSTGEFTELSVAEKKDFLSFYANYVNGRVALYAGTGCITFDQTLELSNFVYGAGYKAPLVIGPFYYSMDQEKIFAYYDALAKKLHGDMYIYNYPARSGHCVSAGTIQRLTAANPNIVGLKDTVNEPSHTNQVCCAMAGTGFEVYSGFDDQFLYNAAAGGVGSFGGLANVVPDIWSDLIRAYNSGNLSRTVALSHLIDRLMPVYEMGSSCSLLFKKLLVHRGVEIDPKAIFPFDEADNAAFETVKEILDDVLADYAALKV